MVKKAERTEDEEAELLALVSEQYKDMMHGSFQPTESFGTISLDKEYGLRESSLQAILDTDGKVYLRRGRKHDPDYDYEMKA